MVTDPKFQHYLLSTMAKYKVSAVGYAIINKYKIIKANTISNTPQIKAFTNSILQACSFSKCLTAYAILKLVAEEKIDLDLAVNKQLETWQIPQSEYSEEITIRQCLSMTSGFHYGALNSSFAGYSQERDLPSLKNILNGEAPATNPPVKICYKPGSSYFYSGAGYMVLQQLIEDKTKQPFTQFMNNHVLKSLDMAHSVFQQPLTGTWKPHAIPGFNANSEMNSGGWDNIPNLASGGLWSTPSDMATFALHITSAYLGTNNSVIPKTLAVEMLTRQKKSNFGLGLIIDGDNKTLNFRKNGHNNGYHNELLMFPNTGQGVVVMTNSAGGISLIEDLIKFVADQYAWPSYSPHFNEIN